MSRAFVREDDIADAPLPDRPVSAHTNFVTAQGLAQIESELTRLQQAYAQAQAGADRAALAHIARDLRYWQQRRASAELVGAAPDSASVHFGSTVTILRDDGRKQTWRIVGEDEAEPAQGTLSYVSPVARALIGRKIGDIVQAGSSEAEIVAIG